MPTSITSTGIQSCTVTEDGRVKGTVGYVLNGGVISDALWFGVAEGSSRNGSKYFNAGGLSENSGEVGLDSYGITLYFLSMNPKYDGVIAEKTYLGEAVDDVSKCY
jgi:hypothetical protein